MILLGLLGVYLINHFDKDNNTEEISIPIEIAE